jgi:hypothetical protein
MKKINKIEDLSVESFLNRGSNDLKPIEELLIQTEKQKERMEKTLDSFRKELEITVKSKHN